MRRRAGHAFIEALFVLPLFLMMVLGFVDLTRWELDRLALWRKARFYSRELATVQSGTESLFQSQLNQFLRQSNQFNVTGRVRVVPLFPNVEKNPLRKKKRIDVIQLILKKPARAISPLFKIINHASPLMLQVKVYEIYGPTE